MSDDLLTFVSRGIGYFSILLQLGLAGVALAKLRVTPTGVLFGLGFSGMALFGLFHRLAYSFWIRPTLDDGGYEEIEVAMTALSFFSSFSSMFFWLLIGIGAFLLPVSLKKRAGAARKSTASFS